MRYFVFYEYVSLTYPDNGLQEIGSIFGKYAYSGLSVVAGRISFRRLIKNELIQTQYDLLHKDFNMTYNSIG
jgi:hypothetical protein